MQPLTIPEMEDDQFDQYWLRRIVRHPAYVWTGLTLLATAAGFMLTEHLDPAENRAAWLIAMTLGHAALITAFTIPMGEITAAIFDEPKRHQA